MLFRMAYKKSFKLEVFFITAPVQKIINEPVPKIINIVFGMRSRGIRGLEMLGRHQMIFHSNT